MIEKLDKFDPTEVSIYHVERLYTKINEVITELNHILEERESEIKVCEEAQDMYDNAILDALKDKQVDVVVEPAENVQDRMIGCTTLDIPKSYKNDQLTLATLDYSRKLEKENSDLKNELERTRKALDVAVDALREIHLPRQWCPVFAEQEIAKQALDQINNIDKGE